MVAQSAATSAIAASSTVAGSYHKDWKEFGKDVLLQEELAHMISKVTLLEAKLMRKRFPEGLSYPAPPEHRVRNGMSQQLGWQA